MHNQNKQSPIVTILALLFAILCFPQLAQAQDDAEKRFSAAVTQLTQDWEAEGWKDGMINLHPNRFTWQSDFYLNLVRDEPMAGRSMEAVVAAKFKGNGTGDSAPEQISPDIWISISSARPYNHVQIGISGVIKTRANRYLNFYGQCERHEELYSFDLCMKRITTVLEAVKIGALVMPDHPLPLTVSGWNASYGLDGVSTLIRSNYNGTVNAVVRASPPMQIPQDRLAEVIRAFSDQAVDDNDRIKENSGTARWVGSTTDPWIRRDFPAAWDGPSVIMAGTTQTPDGRIVLLSVRVPNATWQPSANTALEKAKLYISSGEVEVQRQAIIRAAIRPMPVDGIKAAQIEGVYSVSGFSGTTYSTSGYLFLKDGTVLNNVDDAPAMVSLSQSRTKDANDWGKWRRVGPKMQITWADGNTESIDASPGSRLVGGTKATRLNGYYGIISSGGSLITGSGYVSRSGYTFHPDGSFEKLNSSSFSVGGFVAGEAGPVTIAAGGSASNSGNNLIGKARYEIDGHMLTLTYPDGRIARFSFAVDAKYAGSTRPTSIMLDGSLYNLNGGED
jgi:hypothetical protein